MLLLLLLLLPRLLLWLLLPLGGGHGGRRHVLRHQVTQHFLRLGQPPQKVLKGGPAGGVGRAVGGRPWLLCP